MTSTPGGVSARRAAAVVVGAALALGPGAPAQAHTELVSSVPEQGARLLTAPRDITLTFSEEVTSDLADVALTVPGSAPVVLTTERGASATTLTSSIEQVPATSRTAWRVDYRVTSADGHPIEGTLRFSVQAPAQAATSPADEASPTAPADPTEAHDTQASPVASQTAGADVTVPAIAGGSLLAGLVLVLLLRRSRRAEEGHR